MENHGASKFGKELGLIHEMAVTGRKVGADEAFYAKLAHDEALFRQAVQFVMSGGKIEEVVARTKATVTKTFGVLTGLLKQGSYDILDNWITDEHAPAYTQPDSEAEVEYLDLGYQESSERAVAEMKRRGYRPAEDPEVLRHDMRCPDQLVEGNPVVVLGSVWRRRHGRRDVLILSRVGARRRVSLNWWSGDWISDYRFAAVKLSS